MEVTIKLLENAMRATLELKSKSGSSGWEAGKGRFLIDGFPRKMDQALKFEEDVRTDSSAGIPFLRAFDTVLFINDCAMFRFARRRWCCFSRRMKKRC